MRTTTTRISLVLALTFATAAAASCARVEATVPEAQVTQKSVAFQGVPGGREMGEVSITQTFTLSPDDLSWAKDLNSDIYAYEVELKAVGAVQDLSFIHYAHISMSTGSDDSDVESVELVNYERPDNAVASPVLTAPAVHPVNVSKVWASKHVVLTMELAGIFPEETWAADITLHMSGKISYKL